MLKNIIGVIGGLGPQASVRLYQKCIRMSSEKYGAKDNCDYPHLLISSLPVPDFIQDQINAEKSVKMVDDEMLRLKRAGVSNVLIACNTMHLYESRFKNTFPDGFISLTDLVVNSILSQKIKNIGVLGSLTTIQTKLYQDKLEEHGLSVILPSESQLLTTGDIIERVIGNTNTPTDSLSLELIIDDLMRRGAESVILGCTELPCALVNSPSTLASKLIDTIELLTQEICRLAYLR